MSRLYGAVVAGLILLSGCAENDGWSAMGTDAQPYRQAHADCWAVSMNNAGHAQTGAQMRAYDSCMARQGWADLRWAREHSLSGSP